jgi:hypothetical protein
MNTTELIKLLKGVERGASGRPREISLYIGKDFISEPKIRIEGTGDGCAGAELILKIDGYEFNEKRIAELEKGLRKAINFIKECSVPCYGVSTNMTCDDFNRINISGIEQLLKEVQDDKA